MSKQVPPCIAQTKDKAKTKLFVDFYYFVSSEFSEMILIKLSLSDHLNFV